MLRARSHDFEETVSVRHGRADAHMNPQRPRQHMKDMHRFKPDKILAQRRGNRTWAPPLPKKPFAMDTCSVGLCFVFDLFCFILANF